MPSITYVEREGRKEHELHSVTELKFAWSHTYQSVAAQKLNELFTREQLQLFLGEDYNWVRALVRSKTSRDSSGRKFELACALVAIDGVDLLRKRITLREALKKQFRIPTSQYPTKWVKEGIKVQSFLKDTGFPEEFAGRTSEQNAPFESFPAPSICPELSDYQRKALNSVLEEIHTPGNSCILRLASRVS